MTGTVDFSGRGVWVWEADKHDPARLTAVLKAHRFGYVAVKAHDGTQPFAENEPLLPAYAKHAADHGLAFGLWGYLRAVDPPGEAALAGQLVKRFGAAFYLADAEVEYESARGPVSREFAQAFRTHHPHLPAALSSFGRIDMHTGIDWGAWRSHGFEFQPQAYFCETQELTPKACIAAATHVWPAHAIRPTIGAYKGAAGRPSSQQLAASLQHLPTRGFSVWSAETATEQDYARLSTA
jgi:hypothetical protein